MKHFLWIGALLLAVVACDTAQTQQKLPIYGRRYVEDGDTVYHTIPDFAFINQDGDTLRKSDLLGQTVFVADFFFTTCTTICPKMKGQMMRLYQEFINNEEVMLLSHSIDPEYDTPEVLNTFAGQLGVSSEKWQFLSGVSQEEMFAHGQQGYIVTATSDDSDPDGIMHSGAFLLVDKQGHIRGKYDGTVPIEVDRLMADIRLLLNEK